MTVERKKIVGLIILGILWSGLLAKEWLTVNEPMRVPLTNVAGSAAAPSQARVSVGDLHVHLDLLEAAQTQREMTFTAPRNIFALPRPDTQVVAGETQAAGDLSADDVARQQAVLAELAQYHYLGFIRKEDERRPHAVLAVLTKQDEVHVVSAGQSVENHVVIKAVTPESVTLQDRESRLEQVIPLSAEPAVQP